MRDMTWKTLSSKYVVQDPWATVRADTCERPDGTIVSPYFVYEFTDWATALAITKDGQVIMERQYRHGLGQTNYETPGGCVDKTDANLQDAIARELMEETGYKFDTYEYLGAVSGNPSTNNNLMHLFLATGGEKVAGQNLDAGEDIEVHLFSIDDVIAMLHTDKIVQSMHMVCIMRGLEKLGRLKWV
jgi:8-oxo-dGTP pyrophosphatase MutT (NUDIX family)